ncbi:MAG: WbqC family protein [Proteobacteria bacterium]|nr:WbqC family protein [Pseudomonadota bacterium]
MILSINQPAYLPWIGYFERIAMSDMHVVLDHVQFEKNSMLNRNRLRTATGWSWITVPVKTKGKFGNLPICDVEVADPEICLKHIKSIQANYGRAEYFNAKSVALFDILRRSWDRLIDLTGSVNELLLKELEIETELVCSSNYTWESTKGNLVLEICRHFGATEYISGPFGRNYLDLEAFAKVGVKVRFHDFQIKEYAQCFYGFEPYMSAIDLIINCGESSRDYIDHVSSNLPEV